MPIIIQNILLAEVIVHISSELLPSTLRSVTVCCTVKPPLLPTLAWPNKTIKQQNHWVLTGVLDFTMGTPRVQKVPR